MRHTTAAPRHPATRYVGGALLVAVFIAAVISGVASSAPDGLESAVLKSQCQDAADPDACLADHAGEAAAYTRAPAALADYEVGWLSGIVGVVACFSIGGGLLLVLGRARARKSTP
jgi:hypothetical protein